MFLGPIVGGHGAVPPNAVVEHGGGGGDVPTAGHQVGVLLEVRHAVAVGITHCAVAKGRGEGIQSVHPLPAVGQTVVVRVRVVGRGVDQVLQAVGQTVAISIGSRGHFLGHQIDAREQRKEHQQGQPKGASAHP